MKKLLLLALLLALSNFGQTQTTGPGFVIYVGSAPSGTCSSGAYQEDVIGLGTVYTCQSGTWTQISGGGGGSGTVTSVICGTNLDGGTITVSGTCSVKASPAFTGTPTSPTAAAGTSTTQLATTAFVASAIQGVNPAVAVQAATTTVLPNSPTYSNGASGIGATLTAGSAAALVVDGYTPILNDRILVKTQASSFQNGVYFLSTLGTGIIPYVLTRALDFDMPSDMNNTGAIPVLNGTVNAVTQWVISSTVTTVGTDAVTFTQFSSAPAASCSTVSFSATPTFNAASGVLCFKLTLTGDVTSSTFSNGVSGSNYSFVLCQDSTGGRAFVPPTSMKQYGTWMASASNCVTQQFAYDGTNLNAIAPWNGDTRPLTANAMDDEADSNVCNVSTLWTWANQGGGLCTESNGLIFLTSPSSGTFNLRSLFQATPSAPYTFRAKIGSIGNQPFSSCGIILRESATNKYATISLFNNGSAQASPVPAVEVIHYTSVTAGTSQNASASWSGNPFYVQVQRTSSTLNFSVSSDGINFVTMLSEAMTTPFTTAPDGVGIGVDPITSGVQASCSIDWFRRVQ